MKCKKAFPCIYKDSPEELLEEKLRKELLIGDMPQILSCHICDGYGLMPNPKMERCKYYVENI